MQTGFFDNPGMKILLIEDEVKLAQYLRSHAGPECQYIVVSLKEQLYHMADGLIGVYKDTARESSETVTLDISALPFEAGAVRGN